MNLTHDGAGPINRRAILQSSGCGLGSMALSSLLARDLNASIGTMANPRAKQVIFLHMVGAPSQLDLFDFKPKLQQWDGKKMPDTLWEGLQLAFVREQPNLMGTPFRFHRRGECGMELSQLLPYLGQVADEITLVKTVHTEQFNHAPAQLSMQTGFPRFGRPSLGSWCSYGLGTENDTLPAFVVMNTGSVAGAGNSLWGSGFLPTVHQGVEFRSEGDPVLFLSNPPGVASALKKSVMCS